MKALEILLPALGLALFLEGLPWFVSPDGALRMAARLGELGEGRLRLLGLTMMTAGLTVAWWATR